jgi:predicted metal-dependent hydrolase
MTVNRIIEDKELGPLFVRVNARARRLTFRTKEDGIYVTVPPRTSLAEVENAIEQLRPRLRAARQKQVRKLIDLDYRIDTEFFKLTLVSGQRERFLSRSELGEMQIICPPDADFSDEKLQAWLRKVIEEAYTDGAEEQFSHFAVKLPQLPCAAKPAASHPRNRHQEDRLSAFPPIPNGTRTVPVVR